MVANEISIITKINTFIIISSSTSHSSIERTLTKSKSIDLCKTFLHYQLNNTSFIVF